jgi:ribosomal protein L32
MPFLAHDELDALMNVLRYGSTRKPSTVELLEKLLAERHEPEEVYGTFTHSFKKDITMCKMSASKNGEKLLADIERKNKKQGMGNYRIPHTNITLINYSVCPACGEVFSFKDLRMYYSNPKPDPLFKNRQEQYRQDTRVYCGRCGAYFLPSLVISNGTPKNEVQFLCKTQTLAAIKSFYMKQGKETRRNFPKSMLRDDERRAHINNLVLQDLLEKPTLVANLLQYAPASVIINLIEDKIVQKGDVLYGVWI